VFNCTHYPPGYGPSDAGWQRAYQPMGRHDAYFPFCHAERRFGRSLIPYDAILIERPFLNHNRILSLLMVLWRSHPPFGL
jgi:hypothetical protein